VIPIVDITEKGIKFNPSKIKTRDSVIRLTDLNVNKNVLYHILVNGSTVYLPSVDTDESFIRKLSEKNANIGKIQQRKKRQNKNQAIPAILLLELDEALADCSKIL
jgi:hypothetical protein